MVAIRCDAGLEMCGGKAPLKGSVLQRMAGLRGRGRLINSFLRGKVRIVGNFACPNEHIL